jgi:hypothetical protein
MSFLQMVIVVAGWENHRLPYEDQPAIGGGVATLNEGRVSSHRLFQFIEGVVFKDQPRWKGKIPSREIRDEVVDLFKGHQ